MVLDRVATCNPFLQGKKLELYLEDLNARRIFVKYIPRVVRKNEKLEDFFSRFGEVDYGYVVRDHETQEPKDFGYITFKESTVAQELIKKRTVNFDPPGQGNRKIRVFDYLRRGLRTHFYQQTPLIPIQEETGPPFRVNNGGYQTANQNLEHPGEFPISERNL